MKKILFLIHDLGQGGAEKVLVNLVNNMDRTKFDITVMTLFGGGVNEQFLASDIKYHSVFPKSIPGNSHLMKLFSPKQLHSMFIKEDYDIEVSYLEGPSARIISGCPNKNTKLVSWIHCTMTSENDVTEGFRNLKEAEESYNRMNRMTFVSEGVRATFLKCCKYNGKTEVLYNTIESSKIRKLSQETVSDIKKDVCNLIAVGTLKEVKGFDRLLRIVKRLKDEKYSIHLNILGIGPLQKQFEEYIQDNSLEKSVSLLGYQTNPYKYITKSDMFICSSYSEGFSTAVTEALILGTPVCTVDVSGMRELLGNNNEYGIVTENDEVSLYQGIKDLLDNQDKLKYYREQAFIRGGAFNTEHTVYEVQKMLLEL